MNIPAARAVGDFPAMNRAATLLSLAVLAGCTTHPITGREQVIALPLVQAVHADLGFALYAGAQGFVSAAPCRRDCSSADAQANFALRVDAVAKQLEAAARSMSPELFERIGGFQVEVSAVLGVGTGSSAGGRIALGEGLAGLEPTDTVIAFLVAREMAHVIARHAEEDSGASLVFSALGLLLPGVSIIARFIAGTVGSGALKASWAAQQRREADEIAVELLARAGLAAPSVALGLDSGLRRSRIPADDWGARYAESTQRVALIAAAHPPDAPADH